MQATPQTLQKLSGGDRVARREENAGPPAAQQREQPALPLHVTAHHEPSVRWHGHQQHLARIAAPGLGHLHVVRVKNQLKPARQQGVAHGLHGAAEAAATKHLTSAAEVRLLTTLSVHCQVRGRVLL